MSETVHPFTVAVRAGRAASRCCGALAIVCGLVAGRTPANAGEWSAGASELATIRAAIEQDGTSCVSIVLGYLQRIRGEDTEFRSVTALNPGALDDARRIDALPPERKRALPLLCGPVLIKDNLDLAGFPTTAGSYVLRDNLAVRDAAAVAAIRGAGGIPIAKTNMSEFALNYRGRSALGGQTRNPWAPADGAGGSSSGNAAALAAGFGVLALGTDTSGSARVPAALTGTTGLRPSYGAVATEGVLPLSPSQDVVGPMCRRAADCAVLLRVLAPGLDLGARPDLLRGIRIGVLRSLFPKGAAAGGLVDAINEALARMAADGALVRDVDLRDAAVIVGSQPPAGETATFASRSSIEFPAAMDAYLPTRSGVPRDATGLIQALDLATPIGLDDPAVLADIRTSERNRTKPTSDPHRRVNAGFRDSYVAERVGEAFDCAARSDCSDVLLYPSVQNARFPAGDSPDTGGTHRVDGAARRRSRYPRGGSAMGGVQSAFLVVLSARPSSRRRAAAPSTAAASEGMGQRPRTIPNSRSLISTL